jgi:hypothetical protein
MATWRVLPPLLASATLLAGCGFFGSAPSTSPPTHHHHTPVHHDHHRAPTPSRHHHHGGTTQPPSGGTTGAGSTTYPTPPPPPNVGSYQSLEVQVLGVTRLGTAKDSGKPLPVYALKLQIYNPTPAIIMLALNDLAVVPVGGPPAYSWNDYNTTGLTKTTSLFWPLGNPANPSATFIDVNAGSRVTGLLNVEVPVASRYNVVWGAPSSGQVAATFSP